MSRIHRFLLFLEHKCLLTLKDVGKEYICWCLKYDKSLWVTSSQGQGNGSHVKFMSFSLHRFVVLPAHSRCNDILKHYLILKHSHLGWNIFLVEMLDYCFWYLKEKYCLKNESLAIFSASNYMYGHPGLFSPILCLSFLKIPKKS